MRVKFNADTQIVFQIGDPIEFSCAAFLHNAIYDFANLNAVSLPLKVEKGKLPEFVQAVRLMNINGFDLTTPHKSDIIPLLDECDEPSRIFRCVNHVKLAGGRLIGCGLDGVGMGLAIESATGSVKGKRLGIIGAGSVAGAIAADLCSRGASEVVIVNRTLEKAEYIARTMRSLYSVSSSAKRFSNETLAEVAPNVDLLAQCTTLGPMLRGADFESLDFVDKLPEHCVAADVLYPATTFLTRAAKRGLRVVDGTGMMYHQQFAAMEFRFGVKLPPEMILEAEEALDIAITLRDIRRKRKIAPV
ncbi:MAG: NAD(P)-binding domain-containing protein [Planctomycetota bacterium]|jgi:shikimate dehydrogenase|nr:NAD(P)-binding domain-containing protein [Planctomycetota bacterium]